MKSTLLLTLVFAAFAITANAQQWSKLSTDPYPGKQDDIFSIGKYVWYGNGQGKIYRSADSGKTFKQVYNKPGTFWRCIAFIDTLNGLAGNVGTEYFPNVTDTIPLYRTSDGGNTWQPVKINGPVPKGLCAMFIQNIPFVNHGKLDYKKVIWAAGRVGTPAFVMKSTDLGLTWNSVDLNSQTSMIFDITFINTNEGFICGATSKDVDQSKAQVLKTTDGGKTWKTVYTGKNNYELTWKASFPTPTTGYITIQNYNPDTSAKQRYIIKTTDAGKTWTELPLPSDHRLRQFGIGFISENRGWVGTTIGGYETTDGGKTFSPAKIGRAVNKIRFEPIGNKTVGYAIGVDVFKFQ